jgi:hypothetical protein
MADFNDLQTRFIAACKTGALGDVRRIYHRSRGLAPPSFPSFASLSPADQRRVSISFDNRAAHARLPVPRPPPPLGDVDDDVGDDFGDDDDVDDDAAAAEYVGRASQVSSLGGGVPRLSLARETTSDGKLTTPLHYAAVQGHCNVVQFLQRHGADVNARDANGTTPFQFACVFGHVDAARLMLDGGLVLVNSANNSGDTPLHWAAQNTKLDIVKLLHSTGDVDALLRNDKGQTPQTLVRVKVDAMSPEERIQTIEVVEVLAFLDYMSADLYDGADGDQTDDGDEADVI